MLPEREPEPEKKAILLKTPMVIQDSDFQKLADSRRRDTIICSPLTIPGGTRGGVFVFVEGISRKYVEREGKPYRIVAVIRRKQTKGVGATAKRTSIVTLEGIAEFPRDETINTKLLHWS